MKYSTLGNTDLKVSKICLGTMTWGEQNTQDEAFEQMDPVLSQQKTRFKILKSKEYSGISSSALIRLKRLKCVEIISLDVSTHFLHITHKGLIIAQLLKNISNLKLLLYVKITLKC
jgi:hypothetical protein